MKGVLKLPAKHTQVTGGGLEKAVGGQGPLNLIHEVTTAWSLAISFLSYPDPRAMPQGPHPVSSLDKGERTAVGNNHVLQCLSPLYLFWNLILKTHVFSLTKPVHLLPAGSSSPFRVSES